MNTRLLSLMSITIFLLVSSTSYYAVGASAPSSTANSWTVPAIFAGIGIIGAGYGAWWYHKNVSLKVEKFNLKKKHIDNAKQIALKKIEVQQLKPGFKQYAEVKAVDEQATFNHELDTLSGLIQSDVDTQQDQTALKMLQEFRNFSNVNANGILPGSGEEDARDIGGIAGCAEYLEEQIQQPVKKVQSYFWKQVCKGIGILGIAMYASNKLSQIKNLLGT